MDVRPAPRRPVSFFLRHLHSKKADAMIAALVVTLSSAHNGGDLVVHHLGEATTHRRSKTRICTPNTV